MSNAGRDAQKRQVEFWMAEHKRVPSGKEAMEITGLKYRAACRIRREVCGELPEVDWTEIFDMLKVKLKEKMEDDEISVANLIQMMPFTLAKKTDVKTDSNIEFKITIQKPDEPDE